MTRWEKVEELFCFIHFPINQQLIVDFLSQNNVSMTKYGSLSNVGATHIKSS